MSDKKLNSEQLEAINHGAGPLLIIAGAGTGKTTVITERIKHLIVEQNVKPDEILALTFTEKAAKEMEERIDVALPYGFTQTWTMTFHGFCDRVLRAEGLNIGLDTGYKLISGTTATSLLRKHLFDIDLDYFRPLGNPNKFIAGLLQHFGRLKDEDVLPEDYQEWVDANKFSEELDKQKYQELARVYKYYEELKIKDSMLDFSDLICQTQRLFRDRPNVLKQYQDRFKYILVDEFQDTNFAQNQLINMLVNKNKNITVVADDDQAIYRWRGAAISNVMQFRKTYASAKLVVLNHNYRSTQEILDRSYDLIQHNNPDRLEVAEGINKKLFAGRKIKGERIEFLHADRVENEAEMVADQISKIKDQNPEIEFKDFAILVRANAHSEPFSRSLTRHGVPFQFLGPAQLLQQPEVKDLIAYLRVLNDIHDDPSLFRVLSMDYFKILAGDLANLGSWAKAHNQNLFEAAQTSEVEQVKKVIEIITRHLQLLTSESAGQVLFFFLKDSGILESMLNNSLNEKSAGNIMKFFNKLKSYETENPDASVSAAVEWIDLSMEIGEAPQAADSDWTQNDAVNIITVHSAKGLEFKVVFVVNLVAQRFPSIERAEQIPIPDGLIKEILPQGDFHLQEERRLFYVAMTRACDKLFLTAADFYGEGKREKKISPFVSETIGDAAASKAENIAAQLSLLDWDKPKTQEVSENKKLSVTYLSYSQIQTFLDCPMHYQARYILKIPSQQTASLSFGTSIHNTLKDFYTNSQQDIIELLHKNWITVGYLSKEQAKQFFAKGERFLKEYLQTQYDPKVNTVLLEQNFITSLVLNSRSIKIGGKIDRVDILNDDSIEIIDYKTGANSLTEKEAASNLQLSFYALAATLLKDKPFDRLPNEVKLSLYYFDEQKKVSVMRTVEQLEEAKTKIFEIADQIAMSDFKCSHSILCRNCEYKMLCDQVHE